MRPSPFDSMMLTPSQILPTPWISFQDLSNLSTTNPITSSKMMQQLGSLCMQQLLTFT